MKLKLYCEKVIYVDPEFHETIFELEVEDSDVAKIKMETLISIDEWPEISKSVEKGLGMLFPDKKKEGK